MRHLQHFCYDRDPNDISRASGAGKSRTTQHLPSLHSVALIELDDLQRSIMLAVRDADQRAAMTRAIADLLVQQLIEVRAACIVDGSWIEPERARELQLALIIQQKCRELHMDYIDFSSFEDGAAELERNFLRWSEQIRSSCTLTEPATVSTTMILR